MAQEVVTDRVKVELDVSECPDLETWGKEAQELVKVWYARFDNLMPTSEFKTPQQFQLKIRESNKGLAATSGTKITISSHWIRKNPKDHGVAIHEMVHVLQNYPSGSPWWVTEGIADYLRWAVYEGKPQAWFPRPKVSDGYKKGYRVAAGFLLWLDGEKAPGIVKQLNTSMRRGEYTDQFFKQHTEESLQDLWLSYLEAEF